MQDAARYIPAAFARYASQDRWQLSRHMRKVNWLLMEMMGRRIRKAIISMPPQHGKSTFISNYFTTCYLGNYPDHEAVVASYEATFASLWGARVRDNMIEHGPTLWNLGVKPNQSAADDWRLSGTVDGRKVTGGMRTTGIGGGLIGRPMHLGIIDDPIKDAKQAMSATYRQSIWDWYQSVFSSRFQPETIVVLPMTRWHEDDIVGRLLENERDEWYVLRLPALCENAEDDALDRAVGEPLWPEKYDRNYLLGVQNRLDAYWWASMYQQRPAPVGGGIFKKEWWRFWKYSHMEDVGDFVHITVEGEEGTLAPVITLPSQFDDATQSWDLTFDSTSSRVAGGAWKRRGGNFFLIDETVGEWDFSQQIEALRRFTAAHNIARKLIEDKANARALFSMARYQIAGITLEPVVGDKETRARAISPLIKSGNVYLPHPSIAPWVWDYIDEMSNFPTGRYDDRVDQTAQALKRLHEEMQQRRQSSGTAASGVVSGVS